MKCGGATRSARTRDKEMISAVSPSEVSNGRRERVRLGLGSDLSTRSRSPLNRSQSELRFQFPAGERPPNEWHSAAPATNAPHSNNNLAFAYYVLCARVRAPSRIRSLINGFIVFQFFQHHRITRIRTQERTNASHNYLSHNLFTIKACV